MFTIKMKMKAAQRGISNFFVPSTCPAVYAYRYIILFIFIYILFFQLSTFLLVLLLLFKSLNHIYHHL